MNINASIFYVGESKGGVGKSKVSFAQIDSLPDDGKKALLLESDNLKSCGMVGGGAKKSCRSSKNKRGKGGKTNKNYWVLSGTFIKHKQLAQIKERPCPRRNLWNRAGACLAFYPVYRTFPRNISR
ncbi:hypothetical protein [Desulfovibrio sp. ZJ369]|uniref:hypothetical protein n=1 Tax=Desulfovibrio sp. ZJ369 TaxID=2709793 RepID=UPI0013EB20AE|nr:hypothetical protein [Desulfovibrio sp. ZJ369]